MIKTHSLKQKGFTILVAVVTAGILLIIAMSIGAIALKEQVLATAGKESQTAFYAADSGMECALYWDQIKGVFVPGSTGTWPSTVTFDCNNATPAITTDTLADSTDSGAVIHSYSFKVPKLQAGVSAETCAIVTIIKTTNDSRSINGGLTRNPLKVYTDIYSYGYNTCDPSLRRLERGIEAHY
ncbi:TPA: hypothetical protein DCQ44_03560 [Candidatus Taylorbacteria bacterium]|nr:hypothetical protein [Candidatus Taylorbacteria bacterium]